MMPHLYRPCERACPEQAESELSRGVEGAGTSNLLPLPTSVTVSSDLTGKYFDQDEAGNEATDMGSEGNASGLMMSCGRHNTGSDKLDQKPVAEENPCRKPPEGDKHDQHNQGLNACSRIEHDVGSHNARDRAAGADHGNRGSRVESNVGQRGGYTAEQIKHQVRKMSQVVFDVVPEDP